MRPHLRRAVLIYIFFGPQEVNPEAVEIFLSTLIEKSLDELNLSGCVELIDDFEVVPSITGKIAPYCYLQHKTMRYFLASLDHNLNFQEDLAVSATLKNTKSCQFATENMLNMEIKKDVPFSIPSHRQYTALGIECGRAECASSGEMLGYARKGAQRDGAEQSLKVAGEASRCSDGLRRRRQH